VTTVHNSVNAVLGGPAVQFWLLIRHPPGLGTVALGTGTGLISFTQTFRHTRVNVILISTLRGLRFSSTETVLAFALKSQVCLTRLSLAVFCGITLELTCVT